MAVCCNESFGFLLREGTYFDQLKICQLLNKSWHQGVLLAIVMCDYSYLLTYVLTHSMVQSPS